MPQLSVVIITFNEERNIARCIDSVKELADDIVVVDSFSKDRTKEIPESKGVRVVLHEFLGHIEQKNWAITQAKFPFILSLDADEALSDKLKVSILQAKKYKIHDGYTMNRLTNYCGKWVRFCSWYPDTKLRMWDSTKGKWGGINPHDKFEMQEGSSIAHLKGDILHYSYYTRDDHYRQVEKFTDISSVAFFKMGKKAGFFKIYGSPVFKFFRDYFLKLGFLDGYTGFVICRISAYAAHLKYKKLDRLYKNG
jgi:glycosyltransferase involved in cell wall biosynthesis